MKNYFNQSAADTATSLDVNMATGLTDSEALNRSEKYGKNRLEGEKEKSIIQMVLEQLKDFLVIILIIAALISVALGETLEGVIIIAIVILNTFLGVYQENKASNALKALKEMVSPHAKVLRNGQVVEVASSDVVPGDIAIMEAGDYIPADVRLIEIVNLKVDEAALTGESVPVEKDASVVLAEDASLGDRINCAYMGTVVTYGRGKGIITDIGMNTQMGNIAGMLNDVPNETTPLQKKLDSLGKGLGMVCIGVCGIIFLLGFFRGMEFFDIFMLSVSLAVAAIPEGLTVVVTVVLAMGMQKMVKCNAIIKRLSAVETLGSTTVICSDKTGTLTQNKMTIQKIYNGKDTFDISGTGYSPVGELTGANVKADVAEVKKVVEGSLLCNDATYNPEKETIIGDPTEGAMVVLAHKLSMKKEEWENKYPRIQEIPFDSDRKLMSTYHKIDGQIVMYTKGAPDELLRRCVSIELDGKTETLTDAKREEILKKNQAFAEQALRVIGVAYRVVNKALVDLEMENDLIFVGLVGMIDPPREEAKSAVAICKKAGIQVKMITGDHKITASAIGAQLGIESERTVEGREINEMSDDQLCECVKTTNIFARISPEHKVRLVDAVRANGNIAAMTRDGVNDAPSLKHADIGVAMGMEKEEKGAMDRKPRDPSEPLVNGKMTVAVVLQSLALATGTLGSFAYGYYVHDDLDVARTACFLTLVLGELLRAYSARSESTSIFKMKIFENSYLNKCVLLSMLFMIASIYVPFLNPVFSTIALTFDEMAVALLLAFIPMLGGELAKLITKNMK